VRNLIYPRIAKLNDLAPNYPRGSTLPHNVLDDILINSIVRQIVFTDVFERFYISNGQTLHPDEDKDDEEESVQVKRWWMPLLTFRSEVLEASLSKVYEYVSQNFKYKAREEASEMLSNLLGLHVAMYKPARYRLKKFIQVLGKTRDASHLKELYSAMKLAETVNGIGDRYARRQFQHFVGALSRDTDCSIESVN
jgi:hypothetical protein